MSVTPVILLSCGGLRSIVASAILAQRPGTASVTTVFYDDGRPAMSHRRAAAMRQAEHYEFSPPLDLALPRVTQSGAPGSPRSLRLMAAMDLALHTGSPRIIWPVQVGEDFTALAAVAESILILQQLTKLESGRTVAVDTPLLELTDAQLIQIGAQMNVPWDLAHSCDTPPTSKSAPHPFCGSCPGCQRRHTAFEAAAIEDPLTVTATAGKPH